jgi:4-hydroxy-3-methylbut-2-enyl diphosphate reductase
MRQFEIPSYYKSDIVGKVKNFRKDSDPRKKDFTPTKLDFGNLEIYISRHFGFCYGVENAIEIAYKALDENQGKNIYLLSQMIHNPAVNSDLESRGIRFMQDTEGRQLLSWDILRSDDIVIIPAFGTTLEIEKLLSEKGIEIQRYNTTCPFVEKVWNRSEKLAADNHTLVIHGKYNHEETRATFSHTSAHTHAVIVKDMSEAQKLAKCITGEFSKEEFFEIFKGKHTVGFDPEIHLNKLGVINQTTMLASETQAIAEFLKAVTENSTSTHNPKSFADTRDTLCYATNDNQSATYGLMEIDLDLAIVVGGYNSSNTTHLVELLEQKAPTYFIKDASEIKENLVISHFDIHKHQITETVNWLGAQGKLKIGITSGASCPDKHVDEVILKVIEILQPEKDLEEVLSGLFQ